MNKRYFIYKKEGYSYYIYKLQNADKKLYYKNSDWDAENKVIQIDKPLVFLVKMTQSFIELDNFPDILTNNLVPSARYEYKDDFVYDAINKAHLPIIKYDWNNKII